MPRTAQDKRDARAFAREPIPEMCNGCARRGEMWCYAITAPAYFYEHYGECFAKMDEARAKMIEQTLKFYIPELRRWSAKVIRWRREGLI